MGPMRRDHVPNGVFRQVVGINSVDEFGKEVSIGRQASKRSFLPLRIRKRGSLGVVFDRGIMARQQGKELLRSRFAIERRKGARNRFALARTCLSAASCSAGSVVVLNKTTR